jgi:hypothetical protein
MMTNLITVLVVQLPALAAAAFAIWKAVAAKAKILEHTQRMTSSTPFQPSELDMIGHAARSMAKDYLQDITDQTPMPPTNPPVAVADVPDPTAAAIWADRQTTPGEKTP